MDKFFNRALRHAAKQADRLLKDTAGNMTSGYVFSLTGLGFAGLACLLFVNAGFRVHSSHFGADLLRAVSLF